MPTKLEKTINETNKPITKSDIINALKQLGLHAQSKVEVHASLSTFGFIVNKQYDVLDALIETITQGVIIMPAHTSEMTNPRDWENPPVPKDWIPIIEENRKPFNPKTFMPERIGIIPKTFLIYPGVKRTCHPEVSLSVLNQTNDSHWLDHSFDDRDLIHPLYKLKEEKGHILMMGTDFYTCSSIHLSEFLSDYATIDQYDYEVVINDKVIKKTITTKYFDDDDINFKAISETYIEKYKNTDAYKQVKVGNTTLTLIEAEKLYDIAKAFHLNYKK
ncbi:MAG: AAC(3) family N-acetyltransferase [Tenericutes bacterium]|jgi:aminoglycoside 3-N-acetyltransferase|nr:AAC(3) family N-acetyltransferase [Mycoplasmatota bacterium]